MTIDDVLADVESDRIFYEASDGGVTFSGGEPLSQPAFLLELLVQAKARGLSTCVDTCGAGSRQVLMRIAPLVDTFLFDIKTTDASRHRMYTGLPLTPILANLEALAAVHDDIRVRIPIVPGFTDNDDDLARSAAMVASMRGARRVDLLPYHATGSAKFERLGRTPPMPALTPPTADRMESIASLFHARGLDTHIGG